MRTIRTLDSTAICCCMTDSWRIMRVVGHCRLRLIAYTVRGLKMSLLPVVEPQNQRVFSDVTVGQEVNTDIDFGETLGCDFGDV